MLLPNLYARVRFCHVHWHARPRVRRAPGLPRALFQVEGNETVKPRVKHAARSRKHAQIIASQRVARMRAGRRAQLRLRRDDERNCARAGMTGSATQSMSSLAMSPLAGPMDCFAFV